MNHKLITMALLLVLSGNVIAQQCVVSNEYLDNMEERYVELINDNDESILLRVKVADEVAEQAAGFQHICSQTIETTAILFVFNQAGKRTFHMNNVHANLDIAFISDDGDIDDIQLMLEEFSTGKRQYYPSKNEARYALEVHQGFYQENNITTERSRMNIDG